MKNSYVKTNSYVKIAAFFLAMFIIAVLLFPAMPSYALPPAAPTPISNVVDFAEKSRVRTVYATTAIAADTNTASFCFGDEYQQADYQVTIDQTNVNTISVIIEFSNDGTNWDVGPTVVTANEADATDISRVALFGLCQRFDLDVSNSETVTVGITALPQ